MFPEKHRELFFETLQCFFSKYGCKNSSGNIYFEPGSVLCFRRSVPVRDLILYFPCLLIGIAFHGIIHLYIKKDT